MKKLLMLIILIAFAAPAFAEVTVGTVDIQTVLQEVQEGKAAVEKMSQEIKRLKQILKQEENRLQNNAELFEQKSQQLQAQLQVFEKNLKSSILNRIIEVMREVSVKEGVDMTFERNQVPIFLKSERDLTYKIILAYDKKYPVK
ncbi:MAG: hypothetical protein C0620_06210 [Desulfuromonas sp.]|nr:MAG: hypothetical protein C0620_06210 [Desulfuromonas sp.]